MIDTDKYEGHIAGPWEEYDSGGLTDYTGEYTIKILHKPYDDDDREYELARVLTEWEEGGFLPTSKLIADAPLLLAEVKRLREEKRFVELEHGIGLDNREAQVTIRLNQHYEKQHEKLLAEVKQLQDALKEAVEVVKEMESMAYADADADKFANHALEFIGNVKEMIE